jgi:hypothetical protein
MYLAVDDMYTFGLMAMIFWACKTTTNVDSKLKGMRAATDTVAAPGLEEVAAVLWSYRMGYSELTEILRHKCYLRSAPL